MAVCLILTLEFPITSRYKEVIVKLDQAHRKMIYNFNKASHQKIADIGICKVEDIASPSASGREQSRTFIYNIFPALWLCVYPSTSGKLCGSIWLQKLFQNYGASKSCTWMSWIKLITLIQITFFNIFMFYIFQVYD